MQTVEAVKQRLSALTWTLLRDEARSILVAEAESGVSEGIDSTPEAEQWYGTFVHAEDRAVLVAKRTVLEVQLSAAKDHLEAAGIRRDSTVKEWRTEVRRLRNCLTQLDNAIWTLEQQVVEQVAQKREALVQAKADRLHAEYTALAASMPFNLYNPAIPPSLRNWVLRQQQRGALAVPEYRLFTYLVLRDTVFTAYWNQPPGVEDDEPIESALALAGAPASKTEERWQRLLDQQFMHENGDRRVDRDNQLLRLHSARLAAKKQGLGFSDQYDWNADNDYQGTPTLAALQNPKLVFCALCGSPIRDNVVIKTADGYAGATTCECTTELHTRAYSEYAEAKAALAVHCSKPRRRKAA